MCGQPFDFLELKKIDGQAALDATFDSRMVAVKALGSAPTLDDFEWPSEVPYPKEGIVFRNIEDKAAYDLICMAGAYVFLHEIRHAQLEQCADRPANVLDEEVESDRYALDMMIGHVSEYSRSSGHRAEMVLAKRLLGAFVAKLVILTLTPKKGWTIDSEHPGGCKTDSQHSRCHRWQNSGSILVCYCGNVGGIYAPL